MKLGVVISLAMVAACGGGSDGGDDGDDSGEPDAALSARCLEATEHDDLAWIQTNIFSASCTFSDCHRAPANDADGLVLEPGESHAALVEQPAMSVSGMMLVTPGQPAASYLLVAIGQIAGELPEDGTMPLNSAVMCVEKREAIQRWIAAGAVE